MKRMLGCGLAVAMFLVACAGRVQVEDNGNTVPDTKFLDTGDLGQQVPDARLSDVEARKGDVLEEDTPAGVDAAGACPTAIPVHCGDSLSGNTFLDGRPNEWSGYSCTARLESGPESPLLFCCRRGLPGHGAPGQPCRRSRPPRA